MEKDRFANEEVSKLTDKPFSNWRINFYDKEIEVTHRGKTATAISFSVGEGISATKLNQIISNISLVGQNVSLSATAKATALRTLG